VNSLEKADFKTFNLSASFRFNQDIANLAMEVLKWKKIIGREPPFKITGKGTPENIKSRAVIARTNLGLLLRAIEYVTKQKNDKRIYFEGNINSYTYANEGASLYDVLNLYNYNHRLIRDKLIRKMRHLEELEEYIEKTEEVQLGMMVEIVKEYGNDIPGIINTIKERHIDHDDKGQAAMIFTTVHRSKGMEYDAIQIVNDFISEEKVEKFPDDAKKDELNDAKLNEEINLLYVAITRTKNRIYMPETLMPEDFTSSKQIIIMREAAEKVKTVPALQGQVRKEKTNSHSAEKAYLAGEIRTRHKHAYKPWTRQLDDELTVQYHDGSDVKELANHFGRTRGAIRSRIRKLGLKKTYG
jgi:ATP-dependent exoDNAse (exonuclease V) beta subunit